MGEAETEQGEALRIVSKIYYDYYNNGCCNLVYKNSWEELENEEYEEYWNFKIKEETKRGGFSDQQDIYNIDAIHTYNKPTKLATIKISAKSNRTLLNSKLYFIISFGSCNIVSDIAPM
jgi:hypothetical protein